MSGADDLEGDGGDWEVERNVEAGEGALVGNRGR